MIDDGQPMTDRELDVLVAERVLGWAETWRIHPGSGEPITEPDVRYGDWVGLPSTEDRFRGYTPVPFYSSDITAALPLLEAFDHWQIIRDAPSMPLRVIVLGEWATDPQLPRAICLAVLKAKEDRMP